MQLQKATRKRAKIKMALQGPSGSGKTYSALLLAKGLATDMSKVAIIDTENHSAELYAHLGDFQVLNLDPPYQPEKYNTAIEICVSAEMEVIIIDSITHEWENLLEFHASLVGNSFNNWNKITPRHNAFLQRILQAPCHVIATMRTKQDYVLNEKNGKMVPEKVGLKSVQRDGMEYEFTLVFDLNMKNLAIASKDRTGMFFGKPEQLLREQTGQSLLNWCSEGKETVINEVTDRIGECKSIQELLTVYKMFPLYQISMRSEFEKKKYSLELEKSVTIV